MFNLQLLTLFVVLFTFVSAVRPPIVLFPGLLDSTLEWKLPTKLSAGLPLTCKASESKWTVSWFNDAALPHLMCFVRTLQVDCNPNQLDRLGFPVCTRHFADKIPMRAVGYGTTVGIKSIGAGSPLYSFSYMERLIDRLTEEGWTDNVDVVAAPYMWTHAPSGFAQVNTAYEGEWAGTDFDRHSRLIEGVHERVGRRAVLICHSLGCNTMHAFLHSQGPEWVQAHVASSMMLTPAIAGSHMATGLYFGQKIDQIPVELVHEVGNTWPVVPYLSVLPSFGGDAPVVTDLDSRTYTMRDLGTLVNKYYGKKAADVYNKIVEVAETTARRPPLVPTHVFISTGFRLASRYHVTSKGAHGPVAEVTGYTNSDDTVPYEPLRDLVREWATTMSADELTTETVSGVHHATITADYNHIDNYIMPMLNTLIEKYD